MVKDRKERLAAALRDNLARRKARSRALRMPEGAEGSSAADRQDGRPDEAGVERGSHGKVRETDSR